MKILMVCLGNICRSPLAEGILQEKARVLGLDWSVDSAGTSGWHAGEAPDSRSVQVARQYGISISGQRSRTVHRDDFYAFDHILAMDRSNLRELQRMLPDPALGGKLSLYLAHWTNAPVQEVPDPYYDGGFERVYRLLEGAAEAFVQRYGRGGQSLVSRR